MSTENETVETLEKESPKEKFIAKMKNVSTLASLIMSTLAVIGVVANYAFTDKVEKIDTSNIEKKAISNAKQIESLQATVKSQESVIELKKKLYQAMSDQDKAQSQSITMLQKQIDDINDTIVTPSKDIYSELAVLNVQSAIDYFSLAKDVILFTNDNEKADALVAVAFQKLELVPTVEISAAQRKQIIDDLENVETKETAVMQFMIIEKQINNLDLLTTESLANKSIQPSGKVLSYLNSMVEIQDIPKEQKVLATRESKQFVSNSVYITLIQLQNSLYINDDKKLEDSKKTLVSLIKQYFIQDAKAKKVVDDIQVLHLQSGDKTAKDLDELITELTKHQNQLIAIQKSAKSDKGE